MGYSLTLLFLFHFGPTSAILECLFLANDVGKSVQDSNVGK